MTRRIFVLGSPHKVGGASGEAIGAVHLWRSHGLEVDWIPTWNSPSQAVLDQCQRMGCNVHLISARHVQDIPGIAGSTVVSFCNDNAFAARRRLDELGCRHIFAPLMCFLTTAMRNACNQKHPAAIVFQSQYQRSVLAPQFRAFGYTDDQMYQVRGYIDWSSIPFNPRPHINGSPFVIGRASRSRPSKWNPRWWKMYERIPDRQAILLGVDTVTTQQIGRAPKWATIHKPGTVDAAIFWPQLHAHVTCNDSDRENWPRTGLECMAYGVPTCAENRFGWKEMIEHGLTGMLGETPEQIGDHATLLAKDEDLRMAIVHSARRRLETELANPDLIWEQWRSVLGLPCDVVYGIPPIQTALNQLLEERELINSDFDQSQKTAIPEPTRHRMEPAIEPTDRNLCTDDATGATEENAGRTIAAEMSPTQEVQQGVASESPSTLASPVET